MKCPNHTGKDTVGYCSVCATFGCEECLSQHDGNYYCRKHFKPFAKEIKEAEKHEKLRKKPTRQRLVVRYLDGKIEHGVCFALNPKESGFHLDLTDDDGISKGESIFISFSDLKAVFYVKSFDGKYDKSVHYRSWAPEGGEVVVMFNDGEKTRGDMLHKYRGDEPRFFLIPHDQKSNNISTLVERSAIEGVYTLDEYRARRTEEKVSEKKGEGGSSLSQEETTGDFYLETRNYEEAMAKYKEALSKFPQSTRIRNKVNLAEYNIGIQYIKRRQYPEALECMETVLKSNPRNAPAKKKASQLRHIIEKEKRKSKQSSIQ